MILVWYRDDLRTIDHAPLEWAREHDEDIRAVYVWESPPSGLRPIGAASRWWLAYSLQAHRRRLAELGISLQLVTGDPEQLIPQFAAECGAQAVVWQRRYVPELAQRDAAIKSTLAADYEVRSFPGFLLSEPWEVQTNEGSSYKVYSPYARKAGELLGEDVGPGDLQRPPELEPDWELDEDIRALGLVSEIDWAAGFREHWQPGEAGAWKALDRFEQRCAEYGDYADKRDYPAVPATSRLSPHLRFGEISPVAAWQDISDSTFRSELLWREFAWSRLWARPDLATTNVRAQFDHFPWAWNSAAGEYGLTPPEEDYAEQLQQWRRGHTGVPLVDAGMRELWATGTMHNRVRMVVGSWLTKNLGIHWRHGEEWFWDTLVDADYASNPFNWQWVAGCGDDAAPYFRIFNPLTQEKKFDPKHRYIQRWVPEWGTPMYPEPHVDVKESRARALAAYKDTTQRYRAGVVD
ncbi:Deoxyribodipyrimidine photo-lyase [Corynebacterium ciconiae DSM 44920]|uniref:cryptochrome/photolyase family protein n=1 Tax=Corynebacterium ciconiae TaxID=227319 RepID=UPI000375DF27|nr:deoxyribodipyrimidine photo-lyase [Corynebacterium ciconiae]WKD62023.1 Deoxyribodipyrimidine photo-lyase [Corynebacterium ciconiae DSM 44920]